jgi:hypothetical protein
MGHCVGLPVAIELVGHEIQPNAGPLTVSGSTSTVSLLIATNQQLLLPVNQQIPGEFFLVDPGVGQLEYFRGAIATQQPGIYSAGTPTVSFWNSDNPRMGGTDPWVIGVAAAVPEASSFVLLGLGITGLVAGAWNRSGRLNRRGRSSY